jgi:putative restriction endonuclease
MRYFVAVTDNNWFKYLAELEPNEVNFWRPSGKLFGAVEFGAPFLFKLHSPLNYIVGGGFYIKSYKLPLSLAWDAFERKNGAADLQILKNLISRHRSKLEFDPYIGCILLNEPFFFPKKYWIQIPDNWSKNIVVGKTYDTNEVIGRNLWEKVEQNLTNLRVDEFEQNQPEIAGEEHSRYGQEYLTRARLGQGTFRVMVTEAYHRSCSITGEKTLPVLQASHIKPFSKEGPNRTANGLLLRSDLHILFDRGYITIAPDYRVEVSRKIKEEFNNGREYYPLHGKRLKNLPDSALDRPAMEFINWHNEEIYVG